MSEAGPGNNSRPNLAGYSKDVSWASDNPGPS